MCVLCGARSDEPDDRARLLSTSEVASILGLAPGTVRNRRVAHAGPPWVVLEHGQVRYRASDVADWLERSAEQVSA